MIYLHRMASENTTIISAMSMKYWILLPMIYFTFIDSLTIKVPTISRSSIVNWVTLIFIKTKKKYEQVLSIFPMKPLFNSKKI